MRVHLCGVRGSIATPGSTFALVGGNTSCVAVAAPGEPPALVLDAGTGIRNVSPLVDGPFAGTIILSHLHWDHVAGLPFFTAGDQPGAEVELLVPEQGRPAEALLAGLMGPPYFPIGPDGLRGQWRFSTYDEGTIAAGPFTVLAREIPHKGGRTMGLRVSDGRASLAYLPDHAPHQLGPGPAGRGELHEAALALCQGADLLIHDAQYTDAELTGRAEWGHASAGYVAELAAAAGVANALLFHHHPDRTDAQVAALEHACGVTAAREGVTIDLEGRGQPSGRDEPLAPRRTARGLWTLGAWRQPRHA